MPGTDETISQPTFELMYALVDINGDVETLVAETGGKRYVRYDGMWPTTIDLDVIAKYEVVEVEPSAVQIFDAVDIKSKMVSITDLPVIDEQYLSEALIRWPHVVGRPRYFPQIPCTLEINEKGGQGRVVLLNEFAWWGPTEEHPAGARYVQGKELAWVDIDEVTLHSGSLLLFTTPKGSHLTVRSYSPSDAVKAGASGFPWPEELALDWLDGAETYELSALVKSGGQTDTLAVIAPSGTFLCGKYPWTRHPDLNMIEDDWVDLEDEAYAIATDALARRNWIQVTSLPVIPSDDFRVWARYVDPTGRGKTLLQSHGFEIPEVSDVADLPKAIAFAQDHEPYRRYLSYRIERLGLRVNLPWEEEENER